MVHMVQARMMCNLEAEQDEYEMTESERFWMAEAVLGECIKLATERLEFLKSVS